jgi:hypothetical protein
MQIEKYVRLGASTRRDRFHAAHVKLCHCTEEIEVIFTFIIIFLPSHQISIISTDEHFGGCCHRFLPSERGLIKA